MSARRASEAGAGNIPLKAYLRFESASAALHWPAAIYIEVSINQLQEVHAAADGRLGYRKVESVLHDLLG